MMKRVVRNVIRHSVKLKSCRHHNKPTEETGKFTYPAQRRSPRTSAA